MDVAFGWIFVSTFLLKVIQIESILEIKVGHFSVLRRHPQLRQCAEKALQMAVYVGARISDQTGVCEALPHSWGRNQTFESGYGYVRNVHVHINFEPAFEGHEKTWNIPGVLNTGTKIDVHLTWAKIVYNTLGIVLTEDLLDDESGRWFYIRFYQETIVMSEYGKGGETRVSDSEIDTPHQLRTPNRGKISFVAQRNTLYILVDDVVVKTQELSIVRLNYVRRVAVSNLDNSGDQKLRIHSFEITEA